MHRLLIPIGRRRYVFLRFLVALGEAPLFPYPAASAEEQTSRSPATGISAHHLQLSRIRGLPGKYADGAKLLLELDWTDGFVAISKQAIETIWQLVADSTIIDDVTPNLRIRHHQLSYATIGLTWEAGIQLSDRSPICVIMLAAQGYRPCIAVSSRGHAGRCRSVLGELLCRPETCF